MTVAQLDEKITNMQESKLIKVIQIVEKSKDKIQTPDLFSKTEDKSKKKKNT
jgi:hypothetical protein